MDRTNLQNIASRIREQLPTYLNSSEYDNFVRFLELYYEWLALDDNVSNVTGKITSLTDLDETFDVFVQEFKSELAGAWPTITKIKTNTQIATAILQELNDGENAETSIDTTADQEFFTDGLSAKYVMDYFNPFYYFSDQDVDTKVTKVRVFINDVNFSGRVGESLTEIVENLIPPNDDPSASTGDWVELIEGIDYRLLENSIILQDEDNNPIIHDNRDIIKIRFYLRTFINPVADADSESAIQKLVEESGKEKTRYTNERNFLKLINKFYKQKGSESSYKFLFRALFNEDIEIYYPKENLLKPSSNTWQTLTSLRTVPYEGPIKINQPLFIEGMSSGATASIEYFNDYTLSDYKVREYVISSINGEFSSKETVIIKQIDSSIYEESLYECVVGFEIENPGEDMPRNLTLQNNLSSNGSGYGFAAKIAHTSFGPVENIKIVNNGDQYITGETIEFQNGNTLGSYAIGQISSIQSVKNNFSVSFFQNPESLEYPVMSFDIGLSGFDFGPRAQNPSVTIENIDYLYDDVFYLYDYEDIYNRKITHQAQTFFAAVKDYKTGELSSTYRSSITPVEEPPFIITNLNEGDPTEYRLRTDLEFQVTSVSEFGGITGVAITNNLASPTNVFPQVADVRNQTATYHQGRGVGALFDVAYLDNVITSVTLGSQERSKHYVPGDFIKIDGEQFYNGVSGVHDIFIKVLTVTGGAAYLNLDASSYTTTSRIGSGAVWDIDTDEPTYPQNLSVLLSDANAQGNLSPTTNYIVGDKFTILGSVVGGTDGENDITITVTQVNDEGRIEDFEVFANPIGGHISTFEVLNPTTPMPDGYSYYYAPQYIASTQNGGTSGTGAIFNFIRRDGTTYYVTNPASRFNGINYSAGDSITIIGSELGGVDGINDLVFDVIKIDDNGGILQIGNISGTAINSSPENLNKNDNLVSVMSNGYGATFDVNINNGTYTVTPNQPGANYLAGQNFKIKGYKLAHQYLKEGFKAGLAKVGDHALYTDYGWLRSDNIDLKFDVELTNKELTIDFWYFRKSISITDIDSPGGVIFAINSEDGGTQHLTLWQNYDGTIDLIDSSGNVLGAKSVPFGEWNHIAVYFSNDGTSIYLNGLLENTIPGVNMLNYSTNSNFYIGARQIVDGNSLVIMNDYTLGFFGAFRMTKGQRYVANYESNITLEGDPAAVEAAFDDWYRFSHSGASSYQAIPGDLSAWIYNSSTNSIECTANTGSFTGFIGTTPATNLEFESVMSSTSSDDDTLALIVGFVTNGLQPTDAGYKEYTLSAVRNMGGTTPTVGWGIVYNYLQNDQIVLQTSNVPFISGGWSANGATKVKVIKNGTSVYATTSQNGSTSLDSSTTLYVDLSTNPVLNKFEGAIQWGFGAHSQDAANFSLLDASGSSTGVLVEDKGTQNPVSGNGISPEHVNPIPFKQNIRQSSRYLERVNAVGDETVVELFYDANSAVRIFKVTDSIITPENIPDAFPTNPIEQLIWEWADNYYIWTDGAWKNYVELSPSDYNATTGTAITFTNPLVAGDIIMIRYYGALSDKLEYVIFNSESLVEPNKIRLRRWVDNPQTLDDTMAQYQLPDAHTLTVEWEEIPKSGIETTRLITGGEGYVRYPYGNVARETLSYTSTGKNGVLRGLGKDIGKINRLEIYSNPFREDFDGFGVGYDTPPEIDLSSYGNGQASIKVLTGPLCVREGIYVNQQGFISDDNRIHDGYLWQDYSYVVKVNRYIDEWRRIVKKIVHPAGLMMFGEFTTLTKASVRKGLGVAYRELMFEIIKNVNLRMRNMDGSGSWTYSTAQQTDINDLNSHGYYFVYDNRQLSIDSEIDGLYQGVGTGEISDDTVGAATVDSGSGRYALLDENGNNALRWSDVKKIAINYKDAYGKDYGHYWSSKILGNTFTIYDTSDESMTNDEWINVRPWAKYVVESVELDPDYLDRIAVFDVKIIQSYRELPSTAPQNRVEFRWDNIWRGNVNRQPNYWVGAIADGANPRDGKMVINITGKYMFYKNYTGDLPTLHTTYRSLERFKFYFTSRFPWERLRPLLFSPQREMDNSPYLIKRPIVNGNGLTHIPAKAEGLGIWYHLPVDATDNDWIANTDGTDHNWRNTVIEDIVRLADNKYRAVLDSFINITPVFLIMSEEEPDIPTRKRLGPTNLTIERIKFNDRLQSGLDYNVDRIDYDENLLDLNTFIKYQAEHVHDKSNVAPESSIVLYNTNPTTIEELNEQIVLKD